MVGRIVAILLSVICFIAFGLAAPAGAYEKYSVRKGDSLAKIAKKFRVSVNDIKAVNGLQDNKLKIKQVLAIPDKGRRHASAASKRQSASVETPKIETEIYIVKKGDTLRLIANEAGISVKELKRLNHLRRSSVKMGQKVLVPLREGEQETEDDEIPQTVAESHKSESLGKWKDQDERNLFIKVVKSFLGVPYRLGGNSVRGIDCSAFVKKVYEIFDVTLPRTAREQSLIGKKVDRDELEAGDLVFFKTRRDHVGIYVGDNKFVHLSFKSRQAKVDSMESPYFFNRFLRGVRIKEMTGAFFEQAKNS